MATDLSIGALSRATGVPADTLRTWERRYGFPTPTERTGGAHRRYPLETVERVRLIARALELGHRASAAVTASTEELQDLLALHDEAPRAEPGGRDRADHLGRLFLAVREFDAAGLQSALQRSWNELGAESFLEDCAGPFLTEIGQRWASGEIEVAHEHFASEQTRAFLATQWAALSARATGPTVVCTTPPGEQHVLGLHLAAAALVAGAARVVWLGASTPVDDIITAVEETGAGAVALSASPCSSPGELAGFIDAVGARVPKGVTLIVGGAGFEGVRGSVFRPDSLSALTDWARTRPSSRRR